MLPLPGVSSVPCLPAGTSARSPVPRLQGLNELVAAPLLPPKVQDPRPKTCSCWCAICLRHSGGYARQLRQLLWRMWLANNAVRYTHTHTHTHTHTSHELVLTAADYPNGKAAPPTEKPCSSAQGSACCPDNWQCLDNGLCHYPPDNLWGRYSCSDKDWKSPGCASNLCTYGTVLSSLPLDSSMG